KAYLDKARFPLTTRKRSRAEGDKRTETSELLARFAAPPVTTDNLGRCDRGRLAELRYARRCGGLRAQARVPGQRATPSLPARHRRQCACVPIHPRPIEPAHSNSRVSYCRSQTGGIMRQVRGSPCLSPHPHAG